MFNVYLICWGMDGCKEDREYKKKGKRKERWIEKIQ